MQKLKPDQAPPLAPQTFALAFMTAVEHGESDAQPNDDAGARSQRALFALVRTFAGDETTARAAWLRFNALMGLHAAGALGPFERTRDGGKAQFHPAVLDAASQLRLSANGRFAPKKFMAAAVDIAAVHYADMDDWPLD